MDRENELYEAIFKSLHKMKCIRLDALFDGLTQYEFIIMQIIEKKTRENGKGIYVSEIADYMNVSTPAISRKLGILEEKEFIIRNTDEEDRRNTYVCLTDKGKLVRREACKKIKILSMRVIKKMGCDKVEKMTNLWDEYSQEVKNVAEMMKRGE